MDIQVASNFERYLYYLYDESPEKTQQAMEVFSDTGRLDFSGWLHRIQADFKSKTVSERETLVTIRSFNAANEYILDPHTAVGVNAAMRYADEQQGRPIICLATAHPAKFGKVVTEAIGRQPDLPSALFGLEQMKSRCQVMDAEVNKVKTYIAEHALWLFHEIIVSK